MHTQASSLTLSSLFVASSSKMYNLNMQHSKEIYVQYCHVFLFTDVGVRYCMQNAVNEISADFAWFQTFASMYVRSALSWDFTQHTVVIPDRRFRTSCPETSVWNYHSMLRNIPEERRSQPTLVSIRLTRKACSELRQLCGSCFRVPLAFSNS